MCKYNSNCKTCPFTLLLTFINMTATLMDSPQYSILDNPQYSILDTGFLNIFSKIKDGKS